MHMDTTTLVTDLTAIKRIAQQEDNENIRFRQYVKYRLKWSDRKLDGLVKRIVAEVTAAIDCTQCANCCRVLEVSLCADDLKRLSAHLGMPVPQVEIRYAALSARCERSFAQKPCAFLNENRCSVYAARPRDCREYPHLDKGEFRERMWQILCHAEDCPIIFNALQRMKREIPTGAQHTDY